MRYVNSASTVAGGFIGFFVGFTAGMAGIQAPHLAQVLTLLGAFTSIVTTFLYYTYFQPKMNGTLGKRACGLALVREDFTPISLSQAVTRYIMLGVGCIPLFAGVIAIFFSGRKQGWHDKVSKTVVVSRDFLKSTNANAPQGHLEQKKAA